ncbi:MAG: T9SS type A sorting domain-containing protein [Ferruginibacter sp.]
MKNVYLLVLGIFCITSTTFSQISSIGIGGNWSDPSIWSGGVVPTSTDDVIISDGTFVMIDQDATVANLTVGQGASGILEYDSLIARTLTVNANVTINAGGIFRSSVTQTVTTHVLSANGNITNDGTLDFSTNGNTAGARIIFTGAANTTFSGAGTTTNVSAITVDKGTSAASVVELNTDAFSFQGSTSTAGAIQSFLSIVNGTFKLSGTFTMDNPLFNGTGTYTIPSTGGLWLNNPNFTVNPRAGDADVQGMLRVDAGILNIGINISNRLLYLNGSVLTINGGEINVASRLTASADFGITYTQTGGILRLATIGNSSGVRASLDIEDQGDNSSFTMSGGTIIIVHANSSGAGNRDYFNDATTSNITGGTLQLGNAASDPSEIFFISGSTPAITIDNTTGGHTVQLLNDVTAFGNITANTGTTLNLNDGGGVGHILTQRGNDFINNGTLNGTVPGSTLTFSGSSAQTYGGTGTLTVPLLNLIMSNTAGLTITNPVATDVVAFSLSMFNGDINTGVSTLTVGTGTATPGIFNYTTGTVVGNFKRWYDATVSSRNFPVGIANTTRNVNILFTTAPGVGGTLTASWIPAYAGNNGMPLTEPGYDELNDVASDGYWRVIAGDGLTGGNYTGTFTATNVVTLVDYTTLVLVKRADNVSPWTLDGTHVPTTGSNTTPILQRTGMTGFSEFGIAGHLAPVALNIEYLRGNKQGSTNQLDWKVSCNTSPTATMILERSSDARKFNSITTVTATALRCLQAFNYTDASASAGVNYYRIKLMDAEGKFVYSNVVALLNKEKGFDIVSMMPNPVSTTTLLSIASATASKMDIIVTDASGKKVASRSVNLVAGSNQVPFNFTELTAGTYQLTGYTEEGIKTIRFIKN